MKYFPSLTFHLDETIEDEIRIHTLLEKIHEEQQNRPTPPEES